MGQGRAIAPTGINYFHTIFCDTTVAPQDYHSKLWGKAEPLPLRVSIIFMQSFVMQTLRHKSNHNSQFRILNSQLKPIPNSQFSILNYKSSCRMRGTRLHAKRSVSTMR